MKFAISGRTNFDGCYETCLRASRGCFSGCGKLLATLHGVGRVGANLLGLGKAEVRPLTKQFCVGAAPPLLWHITLQQRPLKREKSHDARLGECKRGESGNARGKVSPEGRTPVKTAPVRLNAARRIARHLNVSRQPSAVSRQPACVTSHLPQKAKQARR